MSEVSLLRMQKLTVWQEQKQKKYKEICAALSVRLRMKSGSMSIGECLDQDD